MKKKHHILFISSWYPNRNDLTHGIFNRCFAEAAAINNQVSILHICSDINLKTDYELVETQEENIYTLIIYYKKINANFPFISQINKLQRFKKLFDIGYHKIHYAFGKPNLIQLNVVMPSGIGVNYLAKKYSIPYIINECWTGYMKEDGGYTGILNKLFTQKIISKAKLIIPVSNRLKDEMIRHKLLGNYEIVPNVVDVELFKPNGNIKNKNVTRFIHISTFDQTQKNVFGIANAFSQALTLNSKLELTFVGDGIHRKTLEDFVNKKQLQNNITFKGQLFGLDLVNEINTNDALIMFSNYESFCLVIAEALACGIPVITSKCGGITNDINDDLGLTVECENEMQLTTAILNFSEIKYTYKVDTIRNFTVNNFSKKMVGQKLTDIYNKVINNNL